MKYNILGFEVDSDVDLMFYKTTNKIISSGHRITLRLVAQNMPDVLVQERKICHYLLYNEELSVTHTTNGTLVVLKNYFWANITYESELETFITYKKSNCCSDVIFAEVFLTEILAIIMKKFGQYVLHGGLFEYMSKRFLVLGCGGTGKSSFIAAVCRSGATFLSDDMVPIVQRGDGLYVSPGHLYFKLCAESANFILDENHPTALYHTGEKIAYCLNPCLDINADGWFKVDYILMLHRSNQEKCILSRVCVMDVFKQLLGSQICGFSNNTTEMSEYLHIIQNASQIPSFQYSYPNGIEHLYSNVKFFLELVDDNMTSHTFCTLQRNIEK